MGVDVDMRTATQLQFEQPGEDVLLRLIKRNLSRRAAHFHRTSRATGRGRAEGRVGRFQESAVDEIDGDPGIRGFFFSGYYPSLLLVRKIKRARVVVLEEASDRVDRRVAFFFREFSHARRGLHIYRVRRPGVLVVS